MTIRPLPPVVRIEPASACNLRCTHCPTGVVSKPRSVMKPALFERVLSEVAKHVPPIRVAVLYHGGEPFLNKHFLSMARQVKALGIPLVKTVSNGMLIKEQMAGAIIDSGLDEIEISLDGDSPATHNAVRLRSEFDQIMKALKALAAANRERNGRVKISVATVQFKQHADPEGLPAPVPSFLKESLGEFAGEVHYKPTWAMLWPSEQPAAGYQFRREARSSTPVTRCSLLEDTISIRADGRVVACCYDLLSQSYLGNIESQTLEEIWRGALYESFRDSFARGDHPPPCNTCGVVNGDTYLVRS